MPESYPTIELGGPIPRRLYQLPPEYPVVAGPRYVDGGQDTHLSFTTPTRRWVIDYEVLDETEGQLLDEHYDSAQGIHLGFDFTDPKTGITYENVKYERYDRPSEDQEWIQSRRITLVKRP